MWLGDNSRMRSMRSSSPSPSGAQETHHCCYYCDRWDSSVNSGRMHSEFLFRVVLCHYRYLPPTPLQSRLTLFTFHPAHGVDD